MQNPNAHRFRYRRVDFSVYPVAHQDYNYAVSAITRRGIVAFGIKSPQLYACCHDDAEPRHIQPARRRIYTLYRQHLNEQHQPS